MSSKKEESEKLKRKIASKKQFDLKCKVCHKKYGKFFTFHHKQYIEGERRYTKILRQPMTTIYTYYQ